MVILDMYDLTNTHNRNSFKNGIMTFGSTTQMLVYVTNLLIDCYFTQIKFMNIILYGTKPNCMLILDMYDLINKHIRNSFKNVIMTFGSTT